MLKWKRQRELGERKIRMLLCMILMGRFLQAIPIFERSAFPSCDLKPWPNLYRSPNNIRDNVIQALFLHWLPFFFHISICKTRPEYTVFFLHIKRAGSTYWQQHYQQQQQQHLFLSIQAQTISTQYLSFCCLFIVVRMILAF